MEGVIPDEIGPESLLMGIAAFQRRRGKQEVRYFLPVHKFRQLADAGYVPEVIPLQIE